MTSILDTLEPGQKELLEQFQAITQSNDLEASIGLLERHDWELERSIQKFYEPSSSLPETTRPATPPSRPNEPPPSASATTTTSPLLSRATNPPRRNRSGILALFMWPFGIAWNLTWTILSFASRLVSRRTITSNQQLSGSNRSTSQPRQDSRASANRFLREFEKSYGENHVEFSQEGYTQTLEQARRNLQFFLVVLQSDEHDDTDHFCRNTLTNQDLMDFIHSKNIIVWGGNVGQTEAYQVSCTLQATTYPFMAVIALQPGSSGSSPKMAVVDRLEGPMPPATLVQRLDTTIQRHGTTMNRMKMERDQRDMERRLREEQDKAYLESLKADQEKERKAQEERKALAAEEEKRNNARLEHELYLKKRQQYIQSLYHSLSEEPSSDYQGKVTKLNFRLANGDRVIRKFKDTDSIETLYQFVEVYPLLQNEDLKSTTPISPPTDYLHKYRFTIHSPFPRTVYNAQEKDRHLLDVSSLWPSATLIVDASDDDDQDEE